MQVMCVEMRSAKESKLSLPQKLTLLLERRPRILQIRPQQRSSGLDELNLKLSFA